MKTPSETSPYDLIQETLCWHPWRMLVACIMLNQTSARQVKPILESFFSRWPDALKCADADLDEMASMIRPLGLQNRRAKTIKKMSSALVKQWIDSMKHGDGNYDIPSLPGIGKYAADSYKIFVEREIVDDVTDKELINYVRWAKEKHARIDTNL